MEYLSKLGEWLLMQCGRDTVAFTTFGSAFLVDKPCYKTLGEAALGASVLALGYIIAKDINRRAEERGEMD